MLSWNGDIHEFLNVYQKNMTDFQDEVNSHLSWLNDDLYLDNDFRLALIIQKLDASVFQDFCITKFVRIQG